MVRTLFHLAAGLIISCLVVAVSSGEDVADKAPTGFPYSDIGFFSENLAPVNAGDRKPYGGKWGYIDRQGKEVIPPSFAVARDFSDGLAPAAVLRPDAPPEPPDYYKAGPDALLWGIIDTHGQWVVKPQFADLRPFREGLAPAAVLNPELPHPLPKGAPLPAPVTSPLILWGFVDPKGQWVVQPVYLEVRDFDLGVARVSDRNGKIGYIDKTGRLLAETMFDEVAPFCEGAARVCEGKMWGFIDLKGNFIAEPWFLDAYDFSEGLAVVHHADDSWGYIDLKGEYPIPRRFDYAGSFRDGLAEVHQDNRSRFIDKTGRVVISLPESTYADGGFIHGVVRVENPNVHPGMSLIDRTGKETFRVKGASPLLATDEQTGVVTVEPYEKARAFVKPDGRIAFTTKWRHAEPFREGLAAVSEHEMDGWGFIDRSGKVVVEPKFSWVQSFSDGRALVCADNKESYIDHVGASAIPPFDYRGEEFSEGRAVIWDAVGEHDVKYGYIDLAGKVVSEMRFDGAGPYHEGLAPVQLGDHCGFVNLAGEFVVKPAYDAAGCFHDGLAPVSLDSKWGFIDKTGKLAIPMIYDEAVPFSEGAAAVMKDGKWGFIDTTGRLIVTPQFSCDHPNEYEGNGCFANDITYDSAFTGVWPVDDPRFSQGLAAVQVGAKWGYVDREVKMVIKPIYDNALDFHDGRAAVRIAHRWFHIDKTGKPTTKDGYDRAESFSDGLAFVRLVATGQLIFPDGKSLTLPGLRRANGASEGLLIVETIDGVGFMDLKGKWVVPPRFEQAWEFHEGLAPVCLDGKWGYINPKGEMVIAPQFAEGAGPFEGGVAVVSTGGPYPKLSFSGLIDRTGKLLTTRPAK